MTQRAISSCAGGRRTGNVLDILAIQAREARSCRGKHEGSSSAGETPSSGAHRVRPDAALLLVERHTSCNNISPSTARNRLNSTQRLRVPSCGREPVLPSLYILVFMLCFFSPRRIIHATFCDVTRVPQLSRCRLRAKTQRLKMHSPTSIRLCEIPSQLVLPKMAGNVMRPKKSK